MKKTIKMISGYLYAHYHWAIAAVLFLMLFTYGGMNNNLISLHLVPVSEHLGISRSTFSLVFSLKGIVAMLSTFFSGFIIARFGGRLTMSVGLVLGGLGYILLARAENVTMLALSSVLIGISYGGCTISAAVVILRLWFHRYEGTVIGIVSAATGAGSSLLSILQTAAMEAGTYRSSLYLCAGVIFAMMILIVLILRNRPESMGLTALGEGEREQKKPKDGYLHYAGLPIKQLWKQPAFYIIFLAITVSSFSLYLVFNVLRNHFLDIDFSMAQATGLYSAMMLLLTFTKFFAGALCDKLGARKVTLICVASGTLGLLLLGMIQNFYVAAVAVVMYTVSLPLLTLMGPLLASDLFGYRAQAQYTGMLVSVVSLSNLAANYVTNLIYDTKQSYQFSFVLAAVLSAVVFFIFLILYRSADRLREKVIAQEKTCC